MQSGQRNERFAYLELEATWEGDTPPQTSVKSSSHSDSKSLPFAKQILYYFQVPDTVRPKAVLVQERRST